MAYVPSSTFGLMLWNELVPYQNDHFGMLCDAIGAMVAPVVDLVFPVGSDGDPGYVPSWGSVFDPSRCPASLLPFLGQFVGVQIPVGTDDVTARQLVLAEAGKDRGSVASVRSAIERNISTVWQPNTAYASGVLVRYGNPVVYYKTTAGFTSGATFSTSNLAVADQTAFYGLQERVAADGFTLDPYHFLVIVDPANLTPVGNSTALAAAIDQVKPAGVFYTLYQTSTPLLSQYTRLLSAVTAQLNLAALADVT